MLSFFRFLTLSVILLSSPLAFSGDYPYVVECSTTYIKNQTECIQDCNCGWCNSSSLCLNGGQIGPFNDIVNKGQKCNLTHWTFNKTCQSFLHRGLIFSGIMISAAVVGIVLWYASSQTCCSQEAIESAVNYPYYDSI